MDITKLADLTDSQRETLYKEYSMWARHHHVLVWTAAAFGVTIQLSTLLLYKNLGPVPYSVVTIGSVFLLLIAHKLAEGNRRQWADYKSVPNRIELVWKLRSEGQNLDTQLNVVSKSTVRVEKWRKALYITFAVIMLLMIAAKWFEESVGRAMDEPAQHGRLERTGERPVEHIGTLVAAGRSIA